MLEKLSNLWVSFTSSPPLEALSSFWSNLKGNLVLMIALAVFSAVLTVAAIWLVTSGALKKVNMLGMRRRAMCLVLALVLLVPTGCQSYSLYQQQQEEQARIVAEEERLRQEAEEVAMLAALEAEQESELDVSKLTEEDLMDLLLKYFTEAEIEEARNTVSHESMPSMADERQKAVLESLRATGENTQVFNDAVAMPIDAAVKVAKTFNTLTGTERQDTEKEIRREVYWEFLTNPVVRTMEIERWNQHREVKEANEWLQTALMQIESGFQNTQSPIGVETQLNLDLDQHADQWFLNGARLCALTELMTIDGIEKEKSVSRFYLPIISDAALTRARMTSDSEKQEDRSAIIFSYRDKAKNRLTIRDGINIYDKSAEIFELKDPMVDQSTGGNGNTGTQIGVKVPYFNIYATGYYEYVGGEVAYKNKLLGTRKQGETFNFASPILNGYEADPTRITGTMGTDDMYFDVVYYTKDSFRLLVYYKDYATGEEIRTRDRHYYPAGRSYRLTAKPIANYTARRQTITGKMPAYNDSVTFYYDKIGGGGTNTGTGVLTVHHYYAGTQTKIAGDHTSTWAVGSSYEYTPPQTINGYSASVTVIRGTMQSGGVERIVYYSKKGDDGNGGTDPGPNPNPNPNPKPDPKPTPPTDGNGNKDPGAGPDNQGNANTGGKPNTNGNDKGEVQTTPPAQNDTPPQNNSNNNSGSSGGGSTPANKPSNGQTSGTTGGAVKDPTVTDPNGGQTSGGTPPSISPSDKPNDTTTHVTDKAPAGGVTGGTSGGSGSGGGNSGGSGSGSGGSDNGGSGGSDSGSGGSDSGSGGSDSGSGGSGSGGGNSGGGSTTNDSWQSDTITAPPED